MNEFSNQNIAKRVLGWTLITFGVIMYVFLFSEWLSGARIITPKHPWNAIQMSLVVYTVCPVLLGSIIMFEKQKKENFL